jgi:hypothetical protein
MILHVHGDRSVAQVQPGDRLVDGVVEAVTRTVEGWQVTVRARPGVRRRTLKVALGGVVAVAPSAAEQGQIIAACTEALQASGWQVTVVAPATAEAHHSDEKAPRSDAAGSEGE